MKKILKQFSKRTAILWIVISILFIILAGLIMRNGLRALNPPILSSYAVRLSYMAYPETLNEIETAPAYLLMNSSTSDWLISTTNYGQDLNYCVNRILLDKEGKVLLDGVVAMVLSERVESESDVASYKSGQVEGYFSIDNTFDRAQIIELRELIDGRDSIAFRLDEYRAEGVKYYPTKLSVWEGNTKLAEYTSVGNGTAVTTDRPLWASASTKDCILNASVEKDAGKAALAEWCKNNMDLVFSEESMHSESGIFKGIEKYSIVNNGEVALVMRAYLDGSFLFKTMVNAAVLIGAELAFMISAIVAVFQWLISRKKAQQHNC